MNTLRLLIITGLTLVGTIATANTVEQILMIKTMPKARAVKLATYIDKAAAKHNVPSNILTALIAQESMFRVGAVNKLTQDYGIGQINIRTIKAYKLDMHRLLTDVDYSIDAAAMALSYFHKRYQAVESKWYCRYNVGTAKFTSQNINRCLIYVAKLKQYQFETLIASTN